MLFQNFLIIFNIIIFLYLKIINIKLIKKNYNNISINYIRIYNI